VTFVPFPTALLAAYVERPGLAVFFSITGSRGRKTQGAGGPPRL
jgi:hypothetical protein